MTTARVLTVPMPAGHTCQGRLAAALTCPACRKRKPVVKLPAYKPHVVMGEYALRCYNPEWFAARKAAAEVR